MLKFCSLTRRKSNAKDCNDLLTDKLSLDNDSIKDLITQRKPIILALSSNLAKETSRQLVNDSRHRVNSYMDVELRIDERALPFIANLFHWHIEQ